MSDNIELNAENPQSPGAETAVGAVGATPESGDQAFARTPCEFLPNLSIFLIPSGNFLHSELENGYRHSGFSH